MASDENARAKQPDLLPMHPAEHLLVDSAMKMLDAAHPSIGTILSFFWGSVPDLKSLDDRIMDNIDPLLD